MNGIDELMLYVMLYLKYAGVDYIKMMCKLSGIRNEKLQEIVRKMEEMKLIEKDSGSSIKRSKARFKKSSEVHKHHTYYRLTRKGKKLIKEMKKEEIEEIMKNVNRNSKLFKSLNYFIEKAYQ